jgi:hypothetical protein
MTLSKFLIAILVGYIVMMILWVTAVIGAEAVSHLNRRAFAIYIRDTCEPRSCPPQSGSMQAGPSSLPK